MRITISSPGTPEGKPQSLSLQTLPLAVFSYCLPLAMVRLLLLATGSEDPVNVLLSNPPSGGLPRFPIPSVVVLLRRRRPIITLFLLSSFPWGKHPSLRRFYSCGRGFTFTSSPLGFSLHSPIGWPSSGLF